MKRTVMVIDDDEDIRGALVDILTDEGYTVIAAENGRVALEMLRKASTLPGLIILDLMMPVLDGHGFRAEQMKDPRIAAVPTCFSSADGRLMQRSELAGLSEYIRKPIELDNLLSIVSEHCG